jgi:hypothetical protein
LRGGLRAGGAARAIVAAVGEALVLAESGDILSGEAEGGVGDRGRRGGWGDDGSLLAGLLLGWGDECSLLALLLLL